MKQKASDKIHGACILCTDMAVSRPVQVIAEIHREARASLSLYSV